MAETCSASFERFLDVLIAERILDLNHGDLMPRLVSSIRESYSAAQSTPFGSQSAAAAIFLKASLHKDSYRKCGVKPIFTPKETQKYLKQRNTIVDWFKRAKSAAARRDSDPQNIVDNLTRVMRYMNDGRYYQLYDGDELLSRIITGEEINFSDSDADTPADSSAMDVDDASGGSTGAGGMPGKKRHDRDRRPLHRSTNVAKLQMKIERAFANYTAGISKIPGVHRRDESYGDQDDPNTNGMESQSMSQSMSQNMEIKSEPEFSQIEVDELLNCGDPTSNVGHLGLDKSFSTSDLPSYEGTQGEGDDMDVPMLSAGDEISSYPDNLGDEGGSQGKPEQGKPPPYYINPTIILHGYANLVTQCYYFIKQVFDKPMSELVAYPEHLHSRHSFLLWQNPSLQHICCKELSFAFANNEITFGKLNDVLINKKSKCCVLENFDLLPPEVQLKVAKYLQKNERLFIILTKRISHVLGSLRSIAFSFRVPSVNIERLVQAATAQKFSPNIFAGLSRNSIIEHVMRAREDIHFFYRTMLALQQKRSVSIRRDLLPLKRIVHCITFQENSTSSTILIKKTIQGLLPLYMHDPFIFWLDFLDEVQAVGTPQLLKAKTMIYHLIAEKSALLAQVTDPRITLEVMFQKMMQIVSGSSEVSPE